MTIRSGGRARERSQARPATPGTYDDAWQPVYEPDARGDRGGRGGGYNGSGYNGGGSNGWDRRPRRGIPGILKFLIFALVLGALVVIVLLTALRPLVRDAVVKWAADNPGALSIGFVNDLVKEDLGGKLTDPASTDTTKVPFVVNEGESAASIAQRLEENGFLQDRRAFIFIATQKNLTSQFESGTFVLQKSMTPDQVVTALLSPQPTQYVTIGLRTGLRLEQITAKLETIDALTMDPKDFYELVKHPPAELLDDYPWLKEVLPQGASLEGFLWPANYQVLPDTTAEELVRDMLDGFKTAIGDRLDVPKARGRTFYQVLTLASMVEREAVVDDERPLIAGVFENRLHKLRGIAPVLASDPTVFYAVDTLALEQLGLPQWRTYKFWTVPKEPLRQITFPPELLGYQTYTQAGLPPGPICTPTIASIDAALSPNTKAGYLYFLAKKDEAHTHAFAKTLKEHNQNKVTYGYSTSP
ncbi:MAG TPA: endolytic transglycosylase MltG [Candidatus Limnocylindrales bacterium]|nr:endolytic transglycosylase MltG [Candidatus Limnocylindrales bacterium]